MGIVLSILRINRRPARMRTSIPLVGINLLSIERCLVWVLIAVLLAATACAPTGTRPDGTTFALMLQPETLSNPKADFAALVWSESKTPLIIGSYLRLKLQSTADAYLSLYAVDTAGETLQLLANHPAQANQTVTLEGPGGLVNYQATPPVGTETYILVATQQPLAWLEPGDIRSPGPLPTLALTPHQLMDRLQLALDTLAPDSWDMAALSRRVEWPRSPSLPKVP